MHMDPLMPALLGVVFVILVLAVLLLFFAGMEISIPELEKEWRVPVVGTLLQIAASVGCASAIGWRLDWPSGRALLLGFIVSLSLLVTPIWIAIVRRWARLDLFGPS